MPRPVRLAVDPLEDRTTPAVLPVQPTWDRTAPLTGPLRELWEQNRSVRGDVPLAEGVIPGPAPQVSEAAELLLRDDAGRVLVRLAGPDVAAGVDALGPLGFAPTAVLPDRFVAEGFVPVERLLVVADAAAARGLGVSEEYRPETGVGSVTSEAFNIQEADRLAALSGVDGTGVRVGVLSDSYNRLGGAAAGTASGDLPPGGLLYTEEGPTSGIFDEGRAMIELVRDVAPGAGLGFASAFYGQAAFGQSIRNLADPARFGADVITDDIFYFEEPQFQDGLIAQAIDDVVVNRGVSYFALAGNLSRQAWETTSPAFSGGLIDFDPSATVATRQPVTLANQQFVRLNLQWDDPHFTTSGVDTDLDFFVYSAATGGTVLTSSQRNNLLTQAPSELVNYTNSSGASQTVYLEVRLRAGPAPGRVKWVNYGANNSGTVTIGFATNSPTIIPHGGATEGLGVGAVNYFAQSVPASFTSAGPLTLLFSPAGSPISPEVRAKPDIAAVQGTNNTFFGGSDTESDGRPNFFGTSAAAPHAAAAAALLLQANPAFTPAEVYARLRATAADVGTAGFDDQTGVGLVNAWRAVNPTPTFAVLPVADGFEAGGLSTNWVTTRTNNGRIQVSGDNAPAAGTRHLLLDAFFGTSLSRTEATLGVNVAAGGDGDLVLGFVSREFADEDNPMPGSFTGASNSDGVAFSVDGTTWTRVVSLTGTNSSAADQEHNWNLSSLAAAAGVTLGATTRVRFQQYDNFPVTSATNPDGLAFDSVRVRRVRLTGIARAAASPTAAGSVSFTVTFDEPVGGVAADDFELVTAGGTSGAAITAVTEPTGTGRSATWTVTASTGNRAGTLALRAQVNGLVTLPTAAGGTIGLTPGGLPLLADAYDLVGTTVTAIDPVGPTATNAGSVQFTVTFAESVSGGVVSDFAVVTTGTLAGVAVTAVTGSGATRTVTVGTGTGEGTIRLTLADGSGLSPVVDNVPFTSAAGFTLDRTPPAAPAVAVNGGGVQRSRVTQLVVSFAEPVRFQGDDVAAAFTLVGPAGPVGLLSAAPTAGQTVFVLTFAPAGLQGGSLADGAYTLGVVAGRVTDAAGNALPAPPAVSLFRLFGDVTGDGTVNADDLTQFASSFGLTAGDAGFQPAFDFDGGGQVNADDLTEFASRFGVSV